MALIGPVGCGKTTFLESLLGNMRPLHGEIRAIEATTAYCAQTPWLCNETIQWNIVGGASMERQRYHHALSLCGVDAIVKQLVEGDNTIVGSKGVSLSGGQRQKIV